MRAALVRGLAVGHRADDRDFVGHLRHMWQGFGKQLAGNLGFHRAERPAVFQRRERLRVEGLLVGHSTGQEDMDDTLRFWGGGALGLFCAGCFRCQKIGQSKSQDTQRSDRKKLATAGTKQGVARATTFAHS